VSADGVRLRQARLHTSDAQVFFDMSIDWVVAGGGVVCMGGGVVTFKGGTISNSKAVRARVACSRSRVACCKYACLMLHT
jgi:hypothetical protein